MSNLSALEELQTVFPTKPLSDCLENVRVPAKVPRSSFLDDGDFPIVSQEADFINGYWNNVEDVVRIDRPVVVFGDHTQVLKLIDFDFVVGADGVKILKPKGFLDAGFLHYFLEANPIQSLGYARHYRHISGIAVPLPSMDEQKRIVAILDKAFAALDRARALAEANLADARDLFDNTLSEIFSLQRQGWVEAAIGDCIRFIDYRGRTPDKTTSGLRLITAKNVKKGYLQDEPREFVAEDSYSGWMTRGIPVQGDVLFTTEAPLGNVAQLDTSDKVVFAQRIIIMQADANRIDSTFLKYMLLSSPVQKRIHAKATGATALGIKASLLKTIKISFPEDITEQRGIVEKIDMLQEKTKRLEALYVSKLIDLANLRQSLLQKAFTGQLT